MTKEEQLIGANIWLVINQKRNVAALSSNFWLSTASVVLWKSILLLEGLKIGLRE